MAAMERFCCGQCGIEFDVPSHFARECHEKGGAKSWYCPNGHSRVFRESTSDVLRRDRDRLAQQSARLDEQRIAAEREAAAAKAALARHKKRAAAGSCPCCKRTFSNMARHMATKHPDFATAEVIPMKKGAA